MQRNPALAATTIGSFLLLVFALLIAVLWLRESDRLNEILQENLVDARAGRLSLREQEVQDHFSCFFYNDRGDE